MRALKHQYQWTPWQLGKANKCCVIQKNGAPGPVCYGDEIVGLFVDDIAINIHDGDLAKVHAANLMLDLLAITHHQPGELVRV